MKIPEICNLLRSELLNNGYEYGFYLDGKKYKPDMSNGFDEEYARLSKTAYRVQPPLVTMREKTGTCVDTVLVMKKLLDEHDITSKIWLTFNKVKGTPHMILTFEAEGKIVYLELTPQSSKPFYGKEIVYESEHDMITEFHKNGYDITDVTRAVVIGSSPEALLSLK